MNNFYGYESNARKIARNLFLISGLMLAMTGSSWLGAGAIEKQIADALKKSNPVTEAPSSAKITSGGYVVYTDLEKLESGAANSAIWGTASVGAGLALFITGLTMRRRQYQ